MGGSIPASAAAVPPLDEASIADQALRALPDAALAALLAQAARALRFHQACDSNGELAAERFWRRAYARARLETVRRRGPLLQAPGAPAAKAASCRRAHEATLESLTRDARHLAQAQRHACHRARNALHETARRAHRFDALVMAGQLARLNRTRRDLRRLVAEADAAIAMALSADRGLAEPVPAPLRQAAE